MYTEIKTSARDFQFFYDIAGEGVPVVNIHGFRLDHRVMKGCFEPVFNAAAGYKRIYFDLPGMGRTAAPAGFRSSDEMLEAVTAFIDKTLPDGEEFLLTGESYGGYLARALVNKMPQRILGACLICPVIFADPRKRKVAEHKVFECEAGLMDKMEFFDRSQFASDIVVQNSAVWRRFKYEVVDAMNCSDIAVLDKIWESSYGLSFDVDDLSAPFDRPSMIVCGANDSVTGYADAFGVLKNFPRASFAVIERAGHYLQIERPALFGSLVSDWLERFEAYRNSGH